MSRLAPRGCLALALGAVACGSSTEPDPPAPEGPPDIMLLLVAGLRADPHDAPGVATRFLDAIEGSPAWSSQNTYAQSPSTKLSMASLLTGHYPSAIPLCGAATRELKGPQPWCTQLPTDRRSLPDILALYGYETAFYHTPFRDSEQLAARFGSSECFTQRDPKQRQQALIEASHRWWTARADTPRLLVTLFTDAMLLPLELGWPPASMEWEFAVDSHNAPSPAPLAREELIGAFDASFDQLAQSAAALERTLEPSPARERLLLVASLHGLSLMETGDLQGFSGAAPVMSDIVLDRTVRVPMALFLDGEGTAVVTEQPLELLDVLPTVLHQAGSTPLADAPGRNLPREWASDDPRAAAYAEFGDMLALRHGPHLLGFRAMLHNATPLNDDLDHILELPVTPAYRLHDVTQDPWQQHDLSQTMPQRAKELHQLMLEMRRGAAAPALDEITPEQMLELKLTASQGYW